MAKEFQLRWSCPGDVWGELQDKIGDMGDATQVACAAKVTRSDAVNAAIRDFCELDSMGALRSVRRFKDRFDEPAPASA